MELFQIGCVGVAGSASNQTAPASSSPAPASSVSSTSIGFGGVATGSNALLNLTVTNSGNATLMISQETVTGAAFSLVGGNMSISVPPGQAHSFPIQFAPQTTGNATGSVVLMSNDRASPQTISLSGTGMQAQISYSPSPVNFGNVNVGGTASQIVTLTDTGNAPLNLNSVQVSGSPFSFAAFALPATITPGQSLGFRLQFAPTAGGNFLGTAAITSNSGNVSINLGGTGVAAPTITIPPASQTVMAGQSATFTVVATGTAPLSYQWMKNGAAISSASSASYATPPATASDNGAQFSVVVTNAAGSTPPAAASLTVNPAPVAPTITAQPASISVTAGKPAAFSVVAASATPLSYQWMKNGASISGANSASYATPPTTASDNGAQFSVVVTNAATSTLSAAASLTVISPGQLTPDSSTLNFGNVTFGGNSTLSITLVNTGSSNITVSAVNVSGSGFTTSGVATGLVLGPGQSAALSVTFAPTAPGSMTGSITLISDAANSSLSVTLSGIGIQPVPHAVTLNWASGSPLIAGYNVYRAEQSAGPYTQINSSLITIPQFTDSSVQSGHTYFYVVTAVDQSNRESANSNEVAVSIPAQQ